jgi:hypothetical protein
MFKQKRMTCEQFLAMCKRMKLLQIKVHRTEWTEWEYRNATHEAYFFLKRSTDETGLACWIKIDHADDL